MKLLLLSTAQNFASDFVCAGPLLREVSWLVTDGAYDLKDTTVRTKVGSLLGAQQEYSALALFSTNVADHWSNVEDTLLLQSETAGQFRCLCQVEHQRTVIIQRGMCPVPVVKQNKSLDRNRRLINSHIQLVAPAGVQGRWIHTLTPVREYT